MRYLYCFKHSEQELSLQEKIDYDIFKPSISAGFVIQDEACEIKTILVRIVFYFITGGRFKIFYVKRNNCIAHTSYVVPKCSKFPFLRENDYEIGPCFTNPNFRGQGIYPRILSEICHTEGNEKTNFYMIVSDTNQASISGIEKAGFIKCGAVSRSRFFKRYKVVNK